MELDKRVRPVLEKIDFIQRYKKISENNSDYEERMKDISVDEVKELAKKLGYELSYNKKENFFKLLEKTDGLQTQLNICLKYGSVELILDIVNKGERYTVGGPFGLIARLLGESERIKYPVFSSYEQLEGILKESFDIYEDIKQGLVESLT